jgi:hypothetical protein
MEDVKLEFEMTENELTCGGDMAKTFDHKDFPALGKKSKKQNDK